MAQQPDTSGEKAKVSVRSYGVVYLGAKVRRRLGLQKNDQARVTVPSAREGTETVKGYINESHSLYVGKEVCERLADGFDGKSTTRVDAIVESGCLRWEDEHGLTENRWDDCHTLNIKE